MLKRSSYPKRRDLLLLVIVLWMFQRIMKRLYTFLIRNDGFLAETHCYLGFSQFQSTDMSTFSYMLFSIF